MDFFQWGQDPWGRQVLIHISWDLLWASAILGVAFIVLHLLYRRLWAPKPASEPAADAVEQTPSLPERVLRHPLAARLFHWLMAACMFFLLATAFLPVVGIQFSWVTIHWIAGLVLIGSVIFHIIHSVFWQDLKSIWISLEELREGLGRAVQAFGKSVPPERPGKYPLANKLYHHIVLLATVGVIATGLLMMAKVPTPFWARNPYLLSPQSWGIVYVVHGLCGVALVTLIMAHIYFAVLPEKRWATLSMLVGWIGRQDYLRYFDPRRWVVTSRPVENGRS